MYFIFIFYINLTVLKWWFDRVSNVEKGSGFRWWIVDWVIGLREMGYVRGGLGLVWWVLGI